YGSQNRLQSCLAGIIDGVKRVSIDREIRRFCMAAGKLDISMRCFLVTQSDDGSLQRQVTTRPLDELPEGEVLVRVRYSSLNFKDALAATGHPGVVSHFPHVPGIDAAGV